MVDLCPVVYGPVIKWWSENQTENKPVYGPKCLVFKWSAKSGDFTIWILDTQEVRYLDEFGIKVFGIQMVTLHIIF